MPVLVGPVPCLFSRVCQVHRSIWKGVWRAMFIPFLPTMFSVSTWACKVFQLTFSPLNAARCPSNVRVPYMHARVRAKILIGHFPPLPHLWNGTRPWVNLYSSTSYPHIFHSYMQAQHFSRLRCYWPEISIGYLYVSIPIWFHDFSWEYYWHSQCVKFVSGHQILLPLVII